MKLVTLALVLSFSNVYAAGGDSGNGGGGIVCLNANGERTVKLLDLREAEKNPGLTITRSNKPWAAQLEAALQKYSAVNADYVKLMRAELKYMASNTIMEDSLRLPPPNDTRITDLNEPRNCFLEGVANYDDVTGKLSIDAELEALMSETDRAALRFHEAWYRVQRVNMSPTDNSLVARKVTGAVFAQEPLKVIPVNQGAENAVSTCTSEDAKYSFHIVPTDDKIELMFTRVNGINLGERTAVIVSSSSRTLQGDMLGSLSEGLKAVIRESSKDERKNRAGSGLDILAQNSVYVNAKGSLSAPLHLFISTSDIISNQGASHLDQFTRVGHSGSEYVWSWKVKKPSVYENVGNYIALRIGAANVAANAHYSNEFNSRFTCK